MTPSHTDRPTQMKEESEKVKDTYGKQQHGAATAFGTAPRKDLLDDLLGVEEAVAGKVHALARAVETQVIPKIEGTVRVQTFMCRGS